MERIKLGKITAPVGIKGEVRVYPYTDEITRFSDIKELEIENLPAKIESVRYQNGMVVLKLDAIADRNAAEAARNKFLYLSKDKLWEVPEDTYFVNDLLGCSVISDEGVVLGKLTDVIQNSSQDLYEISSPEGKQFLLPAVKEFILRVDVQHKEIKVHVIDGLLDL